VGSSHDDCRLPDSTRWRFLVQLLLSSRLPEGRCQQFTSRSLRRAAEPRGPDSRWHFDVSLTRFFAAEGCKEPASPRLGAAMIARNGANSSPFSPSIPLSTRSFWAFALSAVFLVAASGLAFGAGVYYVDNSSASCSNSGAGTE